MRILSFVLILLLSATVGFAQSADQPTGTITVDDSADKDAAIAVRIRDILGELEGYDNVTVTVSSGIVTLRGTTLDTPTALRLNDLIGRVESVVAIENEVVETTDVVERLNPAMDRFTSRMTKLISFIPLALVAGLAFAIIVFAGFFIARCRQPWDRIAPNAFIADIYRQILRIGFCIAGLVVALDILGATALLSTILGAAGIVGLAIGFAVRDTVENFIASIMLSIRQPFRPNDAVEIGGDQGKVIRLTSRATILLSFDGNHIRIPNATVFKSKITNFSRNAQRRFTFNFDVPRASDLNAMRTAAHDAITKLDFALDTPAPKVAIENATKDTVTLRCSGWIDQNNTSFSKARGEAIHAVMRALEAVEKSKAKPKLKPTKTEVSNETDLEELIKEERANLQDDDLLSKDAPEE